MYANHVPVIRDFALDSPYRLLGLGAFILCTIRQPLRQCPRAVRDVARKGHDSKWLFGAKRAGFIYLRDHASHLRQELDACVLADDAERAIVALSAVPCLGIAKAGFFAQCLGLPVGCIDSHNLDRFGLDYEALRVRKTLSPSVRSQKVRRYLDLCADLGGAEFLWDSWCAYVADRQLDLFYGGDAFAVSETHVTAVRQWHN